MQIPLIYGRGFTDDDAPGRPQTAVVNETLARKYFGTVDAVGHRLRQGDQGKWVTVTGVVGDVRNMSREAAAAPQMYLSFWQGDLDIAPVNGADFTVRSSLPADAVIRQMRAMMRNLDPKLALAGVRTMSDLESEAAARRRFQATLLAVFSVVAMLLALIGVYGLRDGTRDGSGRDAQWSGEAGTARRADAACGRTRNWSGGSGRAGAIAERFSLPGADYRSCDLHAGSLALMCRDHRSMLGSECAGGWH
jgi:hypothetical protein